MEDEFERIISYGSRWLQDAKKNDTACEKELLAIVCGVQYYHEHLQSKPFLIRTDNFALKYLNSVKHV